MAEEARNINAYPRFIRFFEGRPAHDIRLLAEELGKVYPGLACLFTHDGHALTACFSSGKDCQLSARQELARWLSSVGGKGGGDDRFAQGGAKMTGEVYQALSQQSPGWD
jgi:alanyl-tRNA synthetase